MTIALLNIVANLTLVVAPFSVLGLTPEEAVALRRAVEVRLSETPRGYELVPPEAVDRAVESLGLEGDELSGCLGEPRCAARIGREAGASRLLLGSAAGLGSSYLLRLSVVDVDRGVVDREAQQSVSGGAEDLAAALPQLVDQIVPPDLRPWYRRWWVWTIVGVVVAGAVTGVILAVALPGGGDDVDTYPLP